jgi:protein gp37
MAENTKIEWCDHSFSPWVGCAKVSPACDHCYAECWAKRSGLVKWGAGEARRRTSATYWKQPIKWNRRVEIAFNAWRLIQNRYPSLTDTELQARCFHKPLRERVFCASLADVFDNEAPDEWRADLFRLIDDTPYLDWILLTKRIGNAVAMLHNVDKSVSLFAISAGYGHPESVAAHKRGLPIARDNVWIGITVCNQKEADRDIQKLLTVPTAKRLLSVEPQLGKIDLSMWLDSNPLISWVICGSESGPHARRDPAMLDWVRALRDQCTAAGVAFFWKQDTINGKKIPLPELDGKVWNEVPA